MFRVPESSSPKLPSTPERSKRGSNSRFFGVGTEPSTTPAGRPPTSRTAASTTPAGPPPSSIFGSRFNSAFPSSSAGRGRLADNGASTQPDDSGIDGEGDAEGELDDGEENFDFRESDSLLHQSLQGLNLPAIVKSIASPPTKLLDSDRLILTTEKVMEILGSRMEENSGTQDSMHDALASASQALLKRWLEEGTFTREVGAIGPGATASPISKAVFLTTLLFRLHHPPSARRGQSTRTSTTDKEVMCIPQILVEWLKDFHDPYPDDLREVLECVPNPAAHLRFWDVIGSNCLRGNIQSASTLLKAADFSYAYTALEDGADSIGYNSKQLANVMRVVNRAITILDSCPGTANGDWTVSGTHWNIFRKRVHQAAVDLEAFAEGGRSDLEDSPNLVAENFGLPAPERNDLSVSTMSRRAESKVPWSVYTSLKAIYGQLLGYNEEVISGASDWLEATIGLAIWWDGEPYRPDHGAITSNRRSATRPQNIRLVDVSPDTAYREKLSLSLKQVLATSEETELQINTINPIEVGIACVLDGELDGLLALLRGWSVVVPTAVIELANYGGWLFPAGTLPSEQLMTGFDESDLMVLSFAKKSQKGINFDDALINYAQFLSKKPQIQDSELETSVEGWEVAIQVLSRLTSTEALHRHVKDLLDGLNFTSPGQIEKAAAVCNHMQMPDLARQLCDRYADDLAGSSDDYGDVLLFYAKAHRRDKVKEVLNVLVISCLVKSTAYPPDEEMDEVLHELVARPEGILKSMSKSDHVAAEMLSSQLSGYATIRRFYEIRDNLVHSSERKRSPKRLQERKSEAAPLLVAAIQSAADSIHGGLFDSDINSVVPLDGLLILLGEALPLVFPSPESPRILSASKLSVLMKTVEDLSAVSSNIFQQCERCLKSSIADFHGVTAPLPRSILKQSTSNMSASTQFSLVDSAVTRSQSNVSEHENSGILIKSASKRGWDWRKGFDKSYSGQDLLKLLRLRLAHEMARAWTDGKN